MSTLCELEVGQQAQVLGVTGADEVSRRLLEMGLTRGVFVKFLGAAPLGDPIEFEVRGYRLCVRKNEAERVEVELQ